MNNIILITADSLRADHTSIYNYYKPTTPNLDDISSTLFKNAYANGPVTPISIPSILTSKYPLEDGHITIDTQPSFVEELEDTHYSTGLVTSNIQFKRFEYVNSFDSVTNLTEADGDDDEAGPSPVVKLAKWGLHKGGTIGKLATIARDTYHHFSGPIVMRRPDKHLFAEAKDWLSTVDEPYFLWLHLMDTHYPYVFEPEHFNTISEFEFDPNRYARILERAMTHTRKGDFIWSLTDEQRQYLIDAYDASIRNFDEQVSEFIDHLDFQTTSVIVSSDHGEEFWEHGHFGHPGRETIPRSMTLYEEIIKVPLMMIGDGASEAQVETPVSLLDIFPTVLDIADVSTSVKHRGESLFNTMNDNTNYNRPIIAQSTCPGDPNHYSEDSESYRLGSIRKGDFKYIYVEDRDNELYNLNDDPEEKHNIIHKNNEVKNELHSTLIEKFGKVTESELETSEGVEERLKQLGYMD